MRKMHQVSNGLTRLTDTIGVTLTALRWMTDDKRKDYYSDLCKADMPHNMEILFSELSTVFSMLSEDLEEIREIARGLKNVQ